MFTKENEYWKSLSEFPGLGRKLRILGVKANDGGCAYYRCIMPLTKLGELFPNCVEVRLTDNPLGIDPATANWKPNWQFEDMHWADVILVNNISNFGGPYTARIIGKGKEFGKFVQMDTDDLLTDLYDEHRLFGVYKDKKLGEITKFIYSHCDLVSVTQHKFATRVQPFCTKILSVIKNSIDYNLPCWNHPKFLSKKVKIGWAGGIHHDPDVKIFAGIPHIVNQKVGRENVQWDFYGHPPPPDKPGEKKDWQHDVWQHYKNTMMKGFAGDKNYNIHFAMPPNAYGVMYANMDIAIAPLALNNFNDSKSEIKVAEAGRYGVPIIASNVGCYNETIVNGETGYLIAPEAGKKAWADVMAKVIKDKKLRETMGKNLKSITDEYFDINKVAFQRLELYKRCFEELNFKIK